MTICHIFNDHPVLCLYSQAESNPGLMVLCPLVVLKYRGAVSFIFLSVGMSGLVTTFFIFSILSCSDF